MVDRDLKKLTEGIMKGGLIKVYIGK